jgi:IS5 family transposase
MPLEQMLDQRHPLYRLAGKVAWAAAEERFGGLYTEESRPGIPIRLMVGLHYLKHAFNESDETVERWVENQYWQYFCGEEHSTTRCPSTPARCSCWGSQRVDRETTLFFGQVYPTPLHS